MIDEAIRELRELLVNHKGVPDEILRDAVKLLQSYRNINNWLVEQKGALK